MTTWLKLIAWTAAVVLPGGVLLLPVLVADRVARRRTARRDATEDEATVEHPA